jgi:hypothetical protein
LPKHWGATLKAKYRHGRKRGNRIRHSCRN